MMSTEISVRVCLTTVSQVLLCGGVRERSEGRARQCLFSLQKPSFAVSGLFVCIPKRVKVSEHPRSDHKARGVAEGTAFLRSQHLDK